MKDRTLKIWETAALIALCIALCTGTWAQARHEALSRDLVRLHVLAHSDDEAEQQIKLRVRDAVLEYMEPRLSGVSDRTEAQLLIRRSMEGIARAASAAAEGRSVQVSLGMESYPTRQYGNIALPAGEYRSLRVVLGDGAGENWWCVVFPPLCTQAVSEEAVRSALSSGELALLERQGGYKLGFRSVEIWNGLVEKLKMFD